MGITSLLFLRDWELHCSIKFEMKKVYDIVDDPKLRGHVFLNVACD